MNDVYTMPPGRGRQDNFLPNTWLLMVTRHVVADAGGVHQHVGTTSFGREFFVEGSMDRLVHVERSGAAGLFAGDDREFFVPRFWLR